MVKLRENFEILTYKSLLGKTMIIGIKEHNSFVKIPRSNMESFNRYIEKIQDNNVDDLYNEFTDIEKKYTEMLHDLGYFNTDTNFKQPFNEYRKIGTEILSFKLPNTEFLHIKNTKLFLFFYIFSSIIFLILLVVFRDHILISLDMKEILKPEYLIPIIILGAVVFISHEFGHYIISQFLGVKVVKLRIGIHIIYPIILIDYQGLMLFPLYKKICIILAGVYTHLLNAVIGIIIALAFGTNPVLDIWIISNVSMILTSFSFTTLSDGYFFITNLIGIMDLRLKGYSGLNNILINKKLSKNRDENICAAVMTVLFSLSFANIFITCLYWANILNVNYKYTIIFAIIYCILMLIKLTLKIKSIRT